MSVFQTEEERKGSTGKCLSPKKHNLKLCPAHIHMTAHRDERRAGKPCFVGGYVSSCNLEDLLLKAEGVMLVDDKTLCHTYLPQCGCKAENATNLYIGLCIGSGIQQIPCRQQV